MTLPWKPFTNSCTDEPFSVIIENTPVYHCGSVTVSNLRGQRHLDAVLGGHGDSPDIRLTLEGRRSRQALSFLAQLLEESLVQPPPGVWLTSILPGSEP